MKELEVSNCIIRYNKIIYKDDIIGSAQKFFSHDNDGVYIYSTTVP